MYLILPGDFNLRPTNVGPSSLPSRLSGCGPTVHSTLEVGYRDTGTEEHLARSKTPQENRSKAVSRDRGHSPFRYYAEWPHAAQNHHFALPHYDHGSTVLSL